MYMTLRQHTKDRVHIAAVAPGHALCGVSYITKHRRADLIPLVGMTSSLEEVIHLPNICPDCKEEVKPYKCKLIISVRWHDCGHCQGPEGHYCNGTLKGHNEGKFDHEFQKAEFWTDAMNKERRKLEKRS